MIKAENWAGSYSNLCLMSNKNDENVIWIPEAPAF